MNTLDESNVMIVDHDLLILIGAALQVKRSLGGFLASLLVVSTIFSVKKYEKRNI